MSLCAYVCTNSFLSSVFKFIWIHCEVFFIGWLVGFHHLNKILMLFYVDSLVSTFTKETWKLNDHCYMIGIEFISFFKEDTFFDEDNKIFKKENSQGFLLYHSQKLWDLVLCCERAGRGWLRGPGGRGRWSLSWNPCHHKIQK